MPGRNWITRDWQCRMADGTIRGRTKGRISKSRVMSFAMSSIFRNLPEKFLVAFSFAGEQRELVRAIAEAVEQRLGRGIVFYDEWFEYYIAGG